jgi:hypothetical protein
MNRMKLILWVSVVCFLISCKQTPKKEKLAVYVGDAQNGLTKKQLIDSNEVVSQLVPQEKDKQESGQVYKFIVYMKTDKAKTTDSVMYQLNYKSAEMFRLVAGADTLQPVLSERVANGKTDAHEFTVVFDMNDAQVKRKNDVEFIINNSNPFQKAIVFDYTYNDITKASKLLYGYDQVND